MLKIIDMFESEAIWMCRQWLEICHITTFSWIVLCLFFISPMREQECAACDIVRLFKIW